MQQTVGQIDQLTTQIAQLNGQISNLADGGESAVAFVGQRTLFSMNRLSSLTDVSVIPSDNTLTLTTAHGTALVAGQQSFSVATQLDSSGVQHIYAQGSDITSTIVSRQLDAARHPCSTSPAIRTPTGYSGGGVRERCQWSANGGVRA